MEFDGTFNCNGKVNVNDWQLSKTSLFLRGEVDNALFAREDYPFSHADVKLFNCLLPGATAILNLKHFVKCIEMKLKILNRYEKYNHLSNSKQTEKTNFYSMRSTVCEFIVYIRSYLNSVKWDENSIRVISAKIADDLMELFITIKRFLSRLRNIPGSTFHYAISNLGNKCVQPEFHMYHMHLELRWLYITLIHNISTPWECSLDNSSENTDNAVSTVIDDLIYISIKLFERIPLADLRLKTPYSCTCMRELWLMLQILVDELATRVKSKTFWEHVNFILDRILNANKSESDQRLWNNTTENSLVDCKNPELFCIWLIYHTALLYGYNSNGVYLESNSARIKPNYEQVDKVLKSYINKGGKYGERDELDEELCVMIPLLRVLVNEWWQSHVQIILLLWDCFHRRLDQPFLLQTLGPWSVSIKKKGPLDILKHVRGRIDGNLDQCKESSYGMFLRLVGTFLRKNYSRNDPKYWNQIKGRIYSKFSKSKVQEFSEAGLYNFFSLFLTLAVTSDTVNVCTVMLNLLPSMHQFNKDDDRRYSLMWKGSLAVLLLYNEQRLNFDGVSEVFMNMVNVISCRKDETSRFMMTSFVDVLNVILVSSESMELAEHSFIGGWIDRYLLECPKNRIGILLRGLIVVFEKCNRLNLSNSNLEGVGQMIDALWTYVACRVRQLIFDPIFTGENYRDLSELAVLFTLEALRDPVTAKRHKHSAASLFQHFTSSLIVKDIRITRLYLMLILQKENTIQNLKKELKNFDTIVIQAWIKCSVLDINADNDQTKVLKNYIACLDQIKQIFLSDFELLEFANSNEAIFLFIMAFMKKRNTFLTEQERMSLDTKCRLYFNNIEKWALIPITDETRESDLAFWIYRCIGTLILFCSPMLYIKNQPNNMFRALINKVILPPEQSTQSYVTNIGKRIFSLIILGLENLNVKGDISLQILIRDLFERYLPLLITEITSGGNCKISDSLLKCFSDAKLDLLHVIIEKLTVSFVTVLSDNTTHKHCYLVILLLRNLLKGGKMYASYITELIITVCMPHVISCYMKVHDLHPHKQQTIDLIHDIVSNSYYKEKSTVREKFKMIVSGSIQKYMLANAHSVFHFVRSLAMVNMTIVKCMLPEIECSVASLESNKRPNAASLRYLLNQLECTLQNMDTRS